MGQAGSAQGTLLVLCLMVTPGDAHGTLCSIVDQTGVNNMLNRHFNLYTISLSPISIVLNYLSCNNFL